MKLDLGLHNTPADQEPTSIRDGDFVSAERRSFMSRATDEVAAWFGNVDALSRRQRDEAVGDHAGKGPASESAPDARLLAEISDRLTQDAKLDASGIRVVVMAGTVTLTGGVRSDAQRTLAEQDALVAGARHVINELIVE